MTVAILLFAAPLAARAADEAPIARGAYVFEAADCVGCHTDAKNNGKRLAGGRALATPFGTFYSPNITPNKETGLGSWSYEDFHRALREGISKHGSYYFPVFPYPSFTGMSDQDIADLWAYLQAQEPVAQRNKQHEVQPPFSWRFLQIGWRELFFSPGPLQRVPGKDAAWNRGNYLATAVAHCGECHTPRNRLGGLEQGKAFSGNPQGPDNLKVPNITPDVETGIGKWSLAEIADLLKTGQKPDFDFVGSAMAEVVKGTSKLTDADREAIAVYLKSLPPISTPKPAKQEVKAE
ncbi:MAG TPA: cytochrome c [Stellaceae bacterium]|nr:cytochrome c [Stellaceae bacterium]